MGIDFRLDGQIALVTGAGKGIGRACVDALAGAGAHVVAVSRTQADLDAILVQWGRQVEVWCCDIGEDSFCQRLEMLDALHILVNNAGTNAPMPFVQVDDATLDRLMDLNIRAAFRAARAAVRVMLRQAVQGGVVINMSSQMGHVGAPERTVYCMTKHAIEGLTRAMAVELAHAGIRVNAVAPTFIETPMTQPMFNNAEFKTYVRQNIPLGKLGSVDDVAAAVLYLASPAARMVTGHSLLIDGGWTAH